MSRDPDVRGSVADALGSVIERIPGVRAARVVVDAERVAEIHVIATTERAPKQLVRDIQSAAKASFDLDIDYRTVSIVQLDDEAAPARAEAAKPFGTRLPLVRVTESTTGQLLGVEVALKQDDLELVGQARGAIAARDVLVARATLQAVEPLLSDRVGDVTGVGIHDVGGTPVAVVAIRLASPGGSRLVSGSAVVAADPKDAVARATLDAINRLAG